jgi:hypothetical protein
VHASPNLEVIERDLLGSRAHTSFCILGLDNKRILCAGALSVGSLEACHEKRLWDLELARIRSDVVELQPMQAAQHTFQLIV